MTNFSLGAVAILTNMADLVRMLTELQLVWGFILGFGIGMVVHAFLVSTAAPGDGVSSTQTVVRDNNPFLKEETHTKRVDVYVYAQILAAAAVIAFLLVIMFSTQRF